MAGNTFKFGGYFIICKMSLCSFVVPLTPEGLLKSETESRYSIVQYTDVTHLSEKEIHKNLDGLF